MSEAKLRELKRLFQIIKNSLSHFSAKNDSPLKDGAEAQLNSILYRRDRACPCPQQITYKIKSTDSRKGCPYGMIQILIRAQQRTITQKATNFLILCNFCARQGVSAMAYAIRRARNNEAIRKKYKRFNFEWFLCRARRKHDDV